MAVSDNPDAMVREALRLDREGRVVEAIAAYEGILARWPALADIWYNLAVLQRQTRQLLPALASYQQALARGVTRPEEAHLNRGVIYADYLRQDEAAQRELNAALALNPVYLPALLNLANLHEDLGRRDEARALYERILLIDPLCFEALARFANLQPVAAAASDERLIVRLRESLAQRAATAADRASLNFALGRLLDARSSYAAAFAAYTEANRASRASAAPGSAAYDRRQHERFIDRLIATEFAGRAPRLARRPQPIFICGMFRSGSTLIEQLLAGGAGVATGGELDFLPRAVAGELAPFPESLNSLPADRLAGLAQRYLDELAGLFPGAAYVTDKRPDNFLNIGLIKAMFPDARIVHTTRNPLDNCLSIYFLHLDHHLAYALDLMDIGHYFREYRRLMAHWNTRFAGDIFDLNYDVLVHAPDDTLQRLAAFLGLEWDPGTRPGAPPGQAVKTASVWQVRQPLYRTSSGRAQHYARELAPLQRYLADLLVEHGASERQ